MPQKNATSKQAPLDENEVMQEENELMKSRRQEVKLKRANETDHYGLALSGGGIRSATFNLGLLQALHDKGFLKEIDYLSTVSGGGYIGSALMWLYHRNPGKPDVKNDFPFLGRADNANSKVNDNLTNIDWIRNHSEYLTPSRGLDQWALVVAFLRGLLTNLFIVIPVLIFFFWLLMYGLDKFWTWFICSMGKIGYQSFVSDFTAKFDEVVIWLKDSIFTSMAPEFLSMVFFSFLIAVALNIGIKMRARKKKSDDRQKQTASSQKEASDGDKKKTAPKEIAKVLIAEVSAWLVAGLHVWLIYKISNFNRLPEGIQPLFLLLTLVGAWLLLKLISNNILLALLSRCNGWRLTYGSARKYDAEYGYLLKWAVGLVLGGIFPFLHENLENLITSNFLKLTTVKLTTITAIVGVASTAVGWVYRKGRSARRGFVAFFLRTGMSFLVAALFFSLFSLVKFLHCLGTDHELRIIFGGLAWSLTLGLLADINYISMHRYYRNRLLEAYFPEQENIAERQADRNNPQQQSMTERKTRRNNPHEFSLQHVNLRRIPMPYPIINTNLVTAITDNDNRSLRGGENYTFTPRFEGSNATGYARTNSRTVDLATALAISGAAVDPHTSETRSLPLKIVMGLLNIRLGYWMRHPRLRRMDKQREKNVSRFWRRHWLGLMYREMFYRVRDDSDYIRLSDGGHFENLGLYELIRRKCKLIIVSDASADPNWEFPDLGQAIERVKVDFKATITIDTNRVKPAKTSRLAGCPYTVGRIKYSDTDEAATLVYVNTALFFDLPEEVLNYSRRYEEFPDEPTSDQFFTEQQFEAYRELGYHAGIKCFDECLHSFRSPT